LPFFYLTARCLPTSPVWLPLFPQQSYLPVRDFFFCYSLTDTALPPFLYFTNLYFQKFVRTLACTHARTRALAWTHTCTNTCASIHATSHAHTWNNMRAHTRTRAHTHTSTLTSAHTHAQMHICTARTSMCSLMPNCFHRRPCERIYQPSMHELTARNYISLNHSCHA